MVSERQLSVTAHDKKLSYLDALFILLSELLRRRSTMALPILRETVPSWCSLCIFYWSSSFWGGRMAQWSVLLPLIKCPQGRWWQEWQRVVQLIKLKLIIYENNHCSEAIRDYRRKHTFFSDIFVVFITFRINYFDL